MDNEVDWKGFIRSNLTVLSNSTVLGIELLCGLYEKGLIDKEEMDYFDNQITSSMRRATTLYTTTAAKWNHSQFEVFKVVLKEKGNMTAYQVLTKAEEAAASKLIRKNSPPEIKTTQPNLSGNNLRYQDTNVQPIQNQITSRNSATKNWNLALFKMGNPSATHQEPTKSRSLLAVEKTIPPNCLGKHDLGVQHFESLVTSQRSVTNNVNFDNPIAMASDAVLEQKQVECKVGGMSNSPGPDFLRSIEDKEAALKLVLAVPRDELLKQITVQDTRVTDILLMDPVGVSVAFGEEFVPRGKELVEFKGKFGENEGKGVFQMGGRLFALDILWGELQGELEERKSRGTVTVALREAIKRGVGSDDPWRLLELLEEEIRSRRKCSKKQSPPSKSRNSVMGCDDAEFFNEFENSVNIADAFGSFSMGQLLGGVQNLRGSKYPQTSMGSYKEKSPVGPKKTLIEFIVDGRGEGGTSSLWQRLISSSSVPLWALPFLVRYSGKIHHVKRVLEEENKWELKSESTLMAVLRSLILSSFHQDDSCFGLIGDFLKQNLQCVPPELRSLTRALMEAEKREMRQKSYICASTLVSDVSVGQMFLKLTKYSGAGKVDEKTRIKCLGDVIDFMPCCEFATKIESMFGTDGDNNRVAGVLPQLERRFSSKYRKPGQDCDICGLGFILGFVFKTFGKGIDGVLKTNGWDLVMSLPVELSTVLEGSELHLELEEELRESLRERRVKTVGQFAGEFFYKTEAEWETLIRLIGGNQKGEFFQPGKEGAGEAEIPSAVAAPLIRVLIKLFGLEWTRDRLTTKVWERIPSQGESLDILGSLLHFAIEIGNQREVERRLWPGLFYWRNAQGSNALDVAKRKFELQHPIRIYIQKFVT